MKKLFSIFIFSCLILVLAVFWNVPVTKAANLILSPNSGSYTVGQNFTVSIYVNSSDQTMNAVGGTIYFPQDKLQAVSINKSGSIVDLWVNEPSFSNSAGTVSFEGIALNPGYQGASGKIFSINFKTIDSGVASVRFTTGSVLANDGNGTNILKVLGTGNYNIAAESEVPIAPKSEDLSDSLGTPVAPKVSSSTHLDSNSWYNTNTATFSWPMPSDVTGVRLLVSRNVKDIPNIEYGSNVNTKTVNDLDDGVWYLHVRLRNSKGWGSVAHFRFQIDTVVPEKLEIKQLENLDTADNNSLLGVCHGDENNTDDHNGFIIQSRDLTSGIDYYNITLDNNYMGKWEDPGDGIYHQPDLEVGGHTLRVEAVDFAGNTITNFIDFEVQAMPLPYIESFPRELSSGDILKINGSTIPNSEVFIWMQKNQDSPKKYTTYSDADGNFQFIYSGSISDGAYSFWVESQNSCGINSFPTDRYTILVRPSKLSEISSKIVNLLSIIVPIIALLLLLIVLLIGSWIKINTMRKRVREEVTSISSLLKKKISRIQKSMNKQIKLLDRAKSKRQLTNEEKLMLQNLRSVLDEIEENLLDKMNNINNATKGGRIETIRKNKPKILVKKAPVKRKTLVKKAVIDKKSK